ILLYRFKHIRFSHLQTEKKAPGFRRKSDTLQLHILFLCTMLQTSISGARTVTRKTICAAFCTLVTSVVMRV
ncbi:hypothetical protein, partial [Terrisporobacter mayombei]|uniref:hypothetical protein n=1 Tax=Terrisporobacter mayombei TaxID=1541 RepID=UPI00265A7C47